MNLPMKFFYSSDGFISETLGEVWLLRARLLVRPFFGKSRNLVFFKPLFTDAAWHRVPLDALEDVVSSKNSYEAMSVLRSHPEYKSPVL
jgi:hypothetical protein